MTYHSCGNCHAIGSLSGRLDSSKTRVSID
nr:MAG TPA: cytochrome C6 [Caudoviricetes sp.]